MRRPVALLIISAVGFLSLPLFAFAAAKPPAKILPLGEITLSSSVPTIAVGKTFTVNLEATSAGKEIIAAVAGVAFAPDRLAVVAAAQPPVVSVPVAKPWTVPGLIAVQGGIKPAKQLKQSPFGSITFKALKPGTTIISIAASSGMYTLENGGADLGILPNSISVIVLPGAVPGPFPPRATTPTAPATALPPPTTPDANLNAPLLAPETTADPEPKKPDVQPTPIPSALPPELSAQNLARQLYCLFAATAALFFVTVGAYLAKEKWLKKKSN